LSIAKHILKEKFEGEISAHNSDNGACFTVKFKLILA
ncbi:MAG: hypothetical protein RL154_127, partial [Pseudomonadota bacterium]